MGCGATAELKDHVLEDQGILYGMGRGVDHKLATDKANACHTELSLPHDSPSLNISYNVEPHKPSVTPHFIYFIVYPSLLAIKNLKFPINKVTLMYNTKYTIL